MTLDFTCTSTDGLTTCRFIRSSGEEGATGTGPGLHERWDGIDRDQRAFLRFGITSDQEALAVYLGLAWVLTDRPARLGQLHFQWHTLHTSYNRSPDAWATWEFSVDAERPTLDRDEGFQRARSGGPPPELVGLGGDSYGSPGGLYCLTGQNELRDLASAAMCDAWGEVTVFGLATERRRAQVMDALGGRRAPTLSELLTGDDRMVHLSIGMDLGYYDSILVAGRGVEKEVQDMAHRFGRAADAYQAAIPEIETSADMNRALERLGAGLDQDGTSLNG